MRKLLVVLICFFSFGKIYAIENIKINDETLSPLFNNSIYVYNYYTNEEEIKISVEKTNNEIVTGYGIYKLNEGINVFNVTSNDTTYVLNVYKNYQKEKESITFKYFNIENYNINFNNDILEYNIELHNNEYLKFNYELDDYNSKVEILNNGNFKSGINDIIVKVSSSTLEKKYIIHAYKEKDEIKNVDSIKELSTSEKNIYLILIIIVCSILSVVMFYFIYIKEHTLLK